MNVGEATDPVCNRKIIFARYEVAAPLCYRHSRAFGEVRPDVIAGTERGELWRATRKS